MLALQRQAQSSPALAAQAVAQPMGKQDSAFTRNKYVKYDKDFSNVTIKRSGTKYYPYFVHNVKCKAYTEIWKLNLKKIVLNRKKVFSNKIMELPQKGLKMAQG